MRSSILLPLCTAALAAAAHHPDPQVVLQDPQATVVEPDEYLIELSPGETRWIKEDEKWELRRVRFSTALHNRNHAIAQLSPLEL